MKLDQFLAEHHLSPYKLACNLRGEVSQTTIYALCRPDRTSASTSTPWRAFWERSED